MGLGDHTIGGGGLGNREPGSYIYIYNANKYGKIPRMQQKYVQYMPNMFYYYIPWKQHTWQGLDIERQRTGFWPAITVPSTWLDMQLTHTHTRENGKGCLGKLNCSLASCGSFVWFPTFLILSVTSNQLLGFTSNQLVGFTPKLSNQYINTWLEKWSHRCGYAVWEACVFFSNSQGDIYIYIITMFKQSIMASKKK